MDEAPAALRRLRWQCRRGMLELDLLLTRFLDGGYQSLRPREKEAFERFLQYSDQMLYDWLFGAAVPADPRLRTLIERIRGPC